MRNRAAQIPDYIFSARIYNESEPRLFVLLKREENYFPVLYNVSRKNIESTDAFEILDSLECDETEENALIDIGEIEVETLKAAELYCAQESIKFEDITKICGLYLLPIEHNKVRNMFNEVTAKKQKN